MNGEKARNAATTVSGWLRPTFFDTGLEHQHHLGIQPGHGIVQQQHLGIQHQGARNGTLYALRLG